MTTSLLLNEETESFPLETARIHAAAQAMQIRYIIPALTSESLSLPIPPYDIAPNAHKRPLSIDTFHPMSFFGFPSHDSIVLGDMAATNLNTFSLNVRLPSLPAAGSHVS